jgi:SAM-dependent methyltransferase
MGKVEINNYEDLFLVLDRLNESIDWNTFYEERVMKAPFLTNNTLPDKMITEFVKTHSIKDAVEFGCGEGRNAIYLAKKGIDVVAIDSSDVAIRNAKRKAEGLNNVRFICNSFLSVDFEDRKYDLVIDSGMFHHLAPHRRLQYRELLKEILKENGYFVLLCFSADEGGAEELDDLDFYTKRNTGVSFSEQRLRDFFDSDFEIISIEKRGQEITEEYIDIPLLYGLVMKLKQINQN